MRHALLLGWIVACRGSPVPATSDGQPDAPTALDAPTPPSGDAPTAANSDAVAPAPTGMAFVPAGTFTMGADSGGEEDEHPAHRVTLAGFWLDRTPVTNEAYARCVAVGVCHPSDSTVASRHDAGRDDDFLQPRHPVIGVSWDDAKTYCTWAGKRLPREAEYERAMRGDDARTYAWGNDPPTPKTTVFGHALGAQGSSTEDVGTHPLGRGPYGHDDLAGNVWEWCEDAYDPYAYRRETADRGIPGSCEQIMATQNELRGQAKQGFTGSNPIPVDCERVLRGGAFNYGVSGLRATNRVHHPARFRIVMAGFRCAL